MQIDETGPRSQSVSGWLVPALAYLFAVGMVGISTKLALRHIDWPLLLVPTTAVYLVLTIWFGVRGELRIGAPIGGWIGFAVLTGVLIAGSFPMLMIALSRGDASRVVPITAAYPIFTAVLAVIFLSESFSVARMVGTLLIVAGAVLVSVR